MHGQSKVKFRGFGRPNPLKLSNPRDLDAAVRGWLAQPDASFSAEGLKSNAFERAVVDWRQASDRVDLGSFFMDERAFGSVFGETATDVAGIGVTGDLELTDGRTHPLRMFFVRTAQEPYTRRLLSTGESLGMDWLSASCVFVVSGRRAFNGAHEDFWRYETLSAVRAHIGIYPLKDGTKFAAALSEFIRIHLLSYSWIDDCECVRVHAFEETDRNPTGILA